MSIIKINKKEIDLSKPIIENDIYTIVNFFQSSRVSLRFLSEEHCHLVFSNILRDAGVNFESSEKIDIGGKSVWEFSLKSVQEEKIPESFLVINHDEYIDEIPDDDSIF